jgi:protein-arginine kinase activator protein McsA
LCERCGTRPVTRISTQIVGGEKRVLYRCDTCAEEENEPDGPRLERPCEQCGQREGTVKWVRLREGSRAVSYVCEECAVKR